MGSITESAQRAQRVLQWLRRGEGLRSKPALLDLAAFATRFGSPPKTILEIGLYEGHQPLEALLELIPDWRVVTRFPNDMLLENCAFRQA